MKVDFDNVRKKTVKYYNTLCRKVRELENENEREDLSLTMDDLRDCVITLICLESEAEGFKSLYLEVDTVEEYTDDEH